MAPKKAVTRQEYDQLVEKVQELEGRIVVLEDKNAVLENVTEKLQKEVERLDALDQYGRRSNIIIRNIELPQRKEDDNQLENKVKEIISTTLQLPAAAADIDKLHRTGKKKDHEGKKYQNIIVRFRSHSSRYSVYKARKRLPNGIKMNPNLRKRRGNILYKSN